MYQIYSLRFQFALALFMLVLLLVLSSGFSLYTLNRQQAENILSQLSARLQLSAQNMAMQSNNYLENQPTNKIGYQRDVNLYLEDMKGHMQNFDHVTMAFMQNKFPSNLTGLKKQVDMNLPPHVNIQVNELEEYWITFRHNIDQALGDDPNMPDLLKAAHFIMKNGAHLEMLTSELAVTLAQQIEHSRQRLLTINYALIICSLISGIVILFWFLMSVLRPLKITSEALKESSKGLFGQQIPITGKHEIAQLAQAYNQLSNRLQGIFRLSSKLQQGSNLEETLSFVAEVFPSLIPLDWVGVLFADQQNQQICIECSFADGKKEQRKLTCFPLKGTLLAKAIRSGELIHIRNLTQQSNQQYAYGFLRLLAKIQRRDVIFLPVIKQTPMPAVLVFASRQANTYQPEHIELLNNIGHLVTHSFGRTLTFVERGRLAHIGQFASGIAHEIRSPLSTINMALAHLQKQNLKHSSQRRLTLAVEESKRMELLLGDILLYAKPLQLMPQKMKLKPFLQKIISQNPQTEKKIRLKFDSKIQFIKGDPARLEQVFINLQNNALDETSIENPITWYALQKTAHFIEIGVHNFGKVIDMQTKAHLFDPFFTTKSSGTGLGLAIVKRIINAHGGEILIKSSQAQGTCFIIRLPCMDNQDKT